MGLYNGGILGLAQLMRTLIVDNLGVSIEFDIAGLLNFMINVPLFICSCTKLPQNGLYGFNLPKLYISVKSLSKAIET